MKEDDRQFDNLIKLHSEINSFLINESKEILKNFHCENSARFLLTHVEEGGTRHLSSTTVCTHALSYYLKFWHENKISDNPDKWKPNEKNDKLYGLQDYLEYIVGTLGQFINEEEFESSNLKNESEDKISPLETIDEFSLLNILPSLDNIISNIQDFENKEQYQTIIDNIVDKLIEEFRSLVYQHKHNLHPFIFYKFCCILDKKDEIDIKKKIYEFGKYEMYRQLALYESNDRSLFDVKRLIYSLLIVTKNNQYSNNLVKDKVFDLIFKEQLDTGLWDVGHVVNNDFVLDNNQIKSKKIRILSTTPILSSVECLNELLSHDTLKEDLVRYKDKLSLTYEWLTKRLRKESGKFGWYPEYEPTHVPKSWVAGHTLIFLKQYSEFISKLINKSAGSYLQVKEPKELDVDWDQLRDSYGIKKFFEYMTKDENNVIVSNSDFRSALIFGPPGTGKSTIAKAFAKSLGWQYVELTPGQFLDKGEQNIIPSANEIFKRLIRMQETVIFFDEVDQLVQLREKQSDPSSKWIVTSLLPKFQELRKQKTIKFILATNKPEKVDEAIIRPGRIDFVLPMGSICWKDRLKILIENVKERNLDNNINNIKDININEIDKKIDKKDDRIKNNECVKNFLQRTDYVPLLEIMDIVKIFDGDFTNEHLFNLFFKDKVKKSEYEKFEDPEFKKFKEIIDKYFRLPTKIRGELDIDEIIENTIFAYH